MAAAHVPVPAKAAHAQRVLFCRSRFRKCRGASSSSRRRFLVLRASWFSSDTGTGDSAKDNKKGDKNNKGQSRREMQEKKNQKNMQKEKKELAKREKIRASSAARPYDAPNAPAMQAASMWAMPALSRQTWSTVLFAVAGVLVVALMRGGGDNNKPNYKSNFYKGRKGRWIRDRTLGGKMAFVPDEPLPSINEKEKRARERKEAEAKRAAAKERESIPPSWWTPPTPPETPPTASNFVEAQAILAAIQNKRVSGKQATTEDIANLYRATATKGVAVRVKTDSVRDSLLKRAVEDAIAPGKSSNVELLAAGERAFVSGLALSLGIAPAQANRVVANTCANRARNAIVAAVSATRRKDDAAAATELSSLAKTLEAFPPDDTGIAIQMAMDTIDTKIKEQDVNAIDSVLDGYGIGGDSAQLIRDMIRRASTSLKIR
ncbi:hypothetical protein NFJ02_08g138610 [Pycnococcus provasolii]